MKITKKEARKLFDKDKFEEVNITEFCDLENVGEFSMCCIDGVLCFKPKEQYPKVFEDDYRKIEVYEDGDVNIYDKLDRQINFHDSLPLLYDAVELSKKLRLENESKTK